MRESCLDCARKHLAQAVVLSHEIPNYGGDLEDDHFWVCIGHLAEAEAQIQKASSVIAEAIRTKRIKLMNSGYEGAYDLCLNSLICMINDLADGQGAAS